MRLLPGHLLFLQVLPSWGFVALLAAVGKEPTHAYGAAILAFGFTIWNIVTWTRWRRFLRKQREELIAALADLVVREDLSR